MRYLTICAYNKKIVFIKIGHHGVIFQRRRLARRDRIFAFYHKVCLSKTLFDIADLLMNTSSNVTRHITNTTRFSLRVQTRSISIKPLTHIQNCWKHFIVNIDQFESLRSDLRCLSRNEGNTITNITKMIIQDILILYGLICIS